MNVIDANDLKTLGISAIEAALANKQEVAIVANGQQRFVVMDMDYYQHLREHELEIAWAQAKADVATGRYVIESAEDHVKNLITEYDLSIDHT